MALTITLENGTPYKRNRGGGAEEGLINAKLLIVGVNVWGYMPAKSRPNERGQDDRNKEVGRFV